MTIDILGPVDYKKTGADTGDNQSTAIQPVNNGEKANQTVFRRPTENVRTRAEVIRNNLDQLWPNEAQDRATVITSDPATQVLWNGPNSGAGDGKFTLSHDLIIAPLNNASISTAQNDIYARLVYEVSASKYFSVRARADHPTPAFALRAANGANNMKFEIFYESGVTFGGGTDVNVTISGSKNDGGDYAPAYGPVLVRVQVSHDGGGIVSTWAEVVNGINTAAAEISDKLFASVDAAETATLASAIAEQFLWESNGFAGITGIGAADAQTFRVTAAELVSFFAGAGVAGMDNGDTLVANLVSPSSKLTVAGDYTVGGLLEIIHRAETDPVTTMSTSAGAQAYAQIPICKVDQDHLYFINGAVFQKDIAGSLMQDTSLRTELAAETVPSGATLIGSSAQAGSPSPHNYTAGTLFEQLGEMVVWFNDHVNANADKHADQAITMTVDPRVHLNFSLAGADLNAQLNDLLTELAQTSSVSGAQRIGALDQTVGTHTINGTYVYDHLTDLLSFIDTHAAGTADKHFIGSITDKPFVVVDAGGKGDYTTIQAAIDVLDTVGGVIYIKVGTYVENISLTAVTKSLMLIGESARNTTIQSTTGTATISGASPLSGSLVFKDLSLYQSGNAEIVDIVTSSTVLFDNCKFTMAYAAAGKTLVELVTGTATDDHATIRDCYFTSISHDDGHLAINCTAGDLYVDKCIFTRMTRVVEYSGTHIFHFRNNKMIAVGYSSGTVPYLIKTPAFTDDIQIHNNYYYDSAVATSNNRCSWVSLIGNGSFSHNDFRVGGSTEEKMNIINISGGVSCIGNYLRMDDGQGIHLQGYSSSTKVVAFKGNTLENFHSSTDFTGSDVFGIRMYNRVVCSGNIIGCASTSIAN